jgi:arylsulfatase A-like enzyme
VLALALPLVLCIATCDTSDRKLQGKFNVVLVVADTLRADHLGSYGYHRDTSPNIDAFAKEALIFLNNRSQAACTFPSINSLLTSRDPFEFVDADENRMGIPDDIPYLPRILKNQGYRTIAISTSPIMRKTPSGFNPTGGFGSGFDEFEEVIWEPAESCANN